MEGTIKFRPLFFDDDTVRLVPVTSVLVEAEEGGGELQEEELPGTESSEDEVMSSTESLPRASTGNPYVPYDTSALNGLLTTTRMQIRETMPIAIPIFGLIFGIALIPKIIRWFVRH